MALELAEIAAGLPMAASFAVAGGINTVREGRRRAALNEAVHELRRPLQALALSLPSDPLREEACESSLRMAAGALERLDREINGGPAKGNPRPVPVRALLGEAVERWEKPAAGRGRDLRLRWRAGDPAVLGEEFELAQALDNLISNAIVHGGGTVTIEAGERADRLRIAVVDSGGSSARGKGEAGGLRNGPSLRARIEGRQRHGHGLRVVARVACRHGGGFQLRRRGQATEARLELPLHQGGARR
jgi:signal transduction histidine kinase